MLSMVAVALYGLSTAWAAVIDPVKVTA